MTDVFEDEVVSPLEQLVGEGKKYATVEDLAKSRQAADEHIARLEREAKEAREFANNLLELRKAAETPSANITPPSVPAKQEPAAETPAKEDLADLVRKFMNETNEEQQRQANVKVVSDKLTEVFGDKAPEALQRKAAELGVSPSFLKDLAAKSPKALLDILNVDAAPTATPAPARSDVRVDNRPLTGAKEGTYSYYAQLRKEKGDAYYFSPKIQNEMFKAASSYEGDWLKT